MADAVIADLRALGLEVQEDGSMGETGSDAGNLLARIPAAHAGLVPEQGHNAIEAAAAAVASLRFGRLDEITTSNVGRIVGGTASNVVAERCRVECEARSVDHDRAAATARDIVDAMTQAATDRACDVEIDVQELFRGFKIPKGATAVGV